MIGHHVGPHTFQGFPHRPHYSYGPHYGAEKAGSYYSGLDVGLPPWWTAVPVAAPFGIGKWAGDTVRRNLPGGRSLSETASDWGSVAKIGLGVGAVVALYFLYRGIRGSAAMSGHAIRGGLRGLREEAA